VISTTGYKKLAGDSEQQTLAAALSQVIGNARWFSISGLPVTRPRYEDCGLFLNAALECSPYLL
jgi:hypothetical protein